MKKLINFLTLVICIISCKKPYSPPAIQLPNNYLVVEGVINIAADSTIIRLSRAVNVSSQVTIDPELHAIVTVEGDNNTSYDLNELQGGKYGASNLALDISHKYRLRITTANNAEYLSSFESALNTPPIDSVGFVIENNAKNVGIQIYVNTHDPSGAIKYYRWDYAEAWSFHAYYPSKYITDGDSIQLRTADQQIDTCYQADSSSTIVLGSAAALKEAVIYQNPIVQVASTSEKIETKYSIQVSQYGLSADAYNFWLNVKKNTEELGSIFAAQPSNIKGNIQCITNSSEQVIGYVSVAAIRRKRVYILNEQLPRWTPDYPYACKPLDTNFFSDKKFRPPINDVAINLHPVTSSEIPAYGYYVNGVLKGFFAAPNYCVDCTIRGNKIPPVFWK